MYDNHLIAKMNMNLSSYQNKFPLKNISFVYIITAGLLLAVFTLLCFWLSTRNSGTLLPVWSDEFFYYVNSENFFQNSTLNAALTYTGKGAPLFGADGHGFAYPLLHGTIGKIFGWHAWNIPVTNCFFILLSVILILFSKVPSHKKILVTAAVAASPVTVLFTFTYMQEALHLFFAVCATLLLLRIYQKKRISDIIGFYLIILMASLFRNSWLFWSIGLLPLVHDRKTFAIYGSAFIISGITAYFFTVFLWDSFPSFFSELSNHLQNGRYDMFLEMFAQNVFQNCISFFGFSSKQGCVIPYLLSNILLFGIIVLLFNNYRTTASKPALGLLLIVIINMLMLIFLFNAWGYRDLRTMSPLITAFFIFAGVTGSRLYAAIIVLFILTTVIPSGVCARSWLSERTNLSTSFIAADKNRIAYQEIRRIRNSSQHPPLIYLKAVPSDLSLDLLLLPLTTDSGTPIRYAVNYFGAHVDTCAFDFFLCKDPECAAPTNDRISITTAYFSLFKIECPSR